MSSAGQIIRQRRSLLACDGRTSIPAGRFYRMLSRVMPVPWDAIPWSPAIHFGLFVHRVEGIEPGLYAMARDAAKVEKLKSAMHAHFPWESPPGCPGSLPLYLLERGDAVDRPIRHGIVAAESVRLPVPALSLQLLHGLTVEA